MSESIKNEILKHIEKGLHVFVADKLSPALQELSIKHITEAQIFGLGKILDDVFYPDAFILLLDPDMERIERVGNPIPLKS